MEVYWDCFSGVAGVEVEVEVALWVDWLWCCGSDIAVDVVVDGYAMVERHGMGNQNSSSIKEQTDRQLKNPRADGSEEITSTQ
jgi:hypothetical protein